MDERVLIDCTTGREYRELLTARELTQRQQDAAAWNAIDAERKAERSKRDEVLVRLAAAVGVQVDDLKQALRVESSDDVPPVRPGLPGPAERR